MRKYSTKLIAIFAMVLFGVYSLSAYPTNLYVVGNISNMTWSYDNAVKCANLGGGKY